MKPALFFATAFLCGFYFARAETDLEPFNPQPNAETQERQSVSPDRQRSVIADRVRLPRAPRVPPQTVLRDGRLITGLPEPETYLLENVLQRNQWVSLDATEDRAVLSLVETDVKDRLMVLTLSSEGEEVSVAGTGFLAIGSDSALINDADVQSAKVYAMLIRVAEADNFSLSISSLSSNDPIHRQSDSGFPEAQPIETAEELILLQSLLVRPALADYWETGDPAEVVEVTTSLIKLNKTLGDAALPQPELRSLQRLHDDAVILADARKNLEASRSRQDSSN